MNSQVSNFVSNLSIPLQQLKIAIVQFKGKREEYAKRQQQLIDILDDAGEQGCRLIVAPECACSEYSFHTKEEALLYSEPFDGNFIDKLVAVSIKYQIWCFVGVIERGQADKIYNSVFVTAPHGEKYCYRKRLLFEADKLWATSGEKEPVKLPPEQTLHAYQLEPLEWDSSPPYPIFNVFGWRTTVGICMDFNDIRFIDFCVHSEADLIVFPTNWIDEGEDVLRYWAAMLQGAKRATLLAANSYGQDGDLRLYGHSAILKANPPTLLGLAPKDGDYLITCTLDYHFTSHQQEKEESL